jgi:hypothetical protein
MTKGLQTVLWTMAGLTIRLLMVSSVSVYCLINAELPRNLLMVLNLLTTTDLTLTTLS